MRDLESGSGAGDGGRPRAVLIAGPTASGKSAFALALAERHRGVVINADSMQVYAGLRILTARPSPEEESRAPHRLYGLVRPSDRYTVARWRDDAAAAIAAAEGEGLLPIITGGTGLYFKALTDGIAAVPPIPDALRDSLAGEADSAGVPALHARLATIDPAGAARLSPNDRTRVLRALEVLMATGRSLAAWQQEPGLPPLLGPAETRRLVLEPERALLYGRIDRRFEAMVAKGALDEVAALLALDLDPSLPAMKAIGVRELGAYLAGRTALAGAIEQAATETRRYAKRQGTWFRNQMADWPRAASAEAGLLLLDA